MLSGFLRVNNNSDVSRVSIYSGCSQGQPPNSFPYLGVSFSFFSPFFHVLLPVIFVVEKEICGGERSPIEREIVWMLNI